MLKINYLTIDRTMYYTVNQWASELIVCSLAKFSVTLMVLNNIENVLHFHNYMRDCAICKINFEKMETSSLTLWKALGNLKSFKYLKAIHLPNVKCFYKLYILLMLLSLLQLSISIPTLKSNSHLLKRKIRHIHKRMSIMYERF